MDGKQSGNKTITNKFDKMWMDSLLSLQPSNAYLEAWNGVIVSDRESGYGISNEAANELFVDLPGQIRGMIYVEERDQYVVFLDTTDGGEIGIIKEKTKSYSRITTTEIAPELGICMDQWIDCEVKIVQPCNNLYLYWSSGDVYKRLNLDDPCCKFEEIPLIKPVCVATIETDVVEKGGGLPNGIYHFAAKARDTEGNDSNWSRISNPVSISDGDHKAGERSGKAINLKISGMSNRDYHIVDLAVISTIDNITAIQQFASVSSSNDSDVINYLYSGKTGREFDLQLSDILTRTNRYIRGKNLIQYDNRLILYNLRPIHNLDYQRLANEIETFYETYLVPEPYAEDFKAARPNENYQPAIRWNYEDGTSSSDFLIPGLPGGPGLCDPYQDTSVRLNTYLDLDGLAYEKDFEVGEETDYTPDKPLEDETTAVDESDIDSPTIGDEINDKIGELDYADFEMGAALDCLCEKLDDIADNEVIFVSNDSGAIPIIPVRGRGVWDLDDDVLGAITLEYLQCMCTSRTASQPDTGGNGGEVDPVDGGVGNLVASDILSYLNQEYVSDAISVEGRFPERPIRWLRDKIKWMFEESEADKARFKLNKGVKQGSVCHNEGETNCVGELCYGCRNGEWVYLNGGQSYDVNNSYTKTGPIKDTKDLGFEYEYAEDGCTVLGIKPKLYTDGKFGAWEVEETYPMTLNCECEFIYGDLAGEKIRLHHAPSVSKEPHFISFSSGVPSRYDQANSEFKDTYVVMIGWRFENIQPPENLPKPLCKANPYSITYVERTEANKTVIGSALGHSCFLGEVGGEPHAIPKHAMNSFERFDRSIEPSGDSTFRGGTAIDVGAYFVHSPDFHMRKPGLSATHCLIELEHLGKGFRHGLFSKGEKPETKWQDRLHQKGTRQSINMNHYISPGEPIVREVQAMSYAPADSIVTKSDKFTYSLSNQHRESGVYVELQGGLEEFSEGDAARGMVGMYGGADNNGDNASDRSFTGDTYTESIPIHDARGHLMTFIRRLPHQYGSPISQSYIPLGLEAKGLTDKISGLVGDSFVGAMTYKRSGLVSDKTNRVISRFVLEGGLSSSSSFVARVFGNLLSYLFKVLGIRNGGYVPKNQDKSDYMRIFGGLRFINATTLPIVGGGNVANPGEVREGLIPDPFPRDLFTDRTVIGTDVNFGDNYVPQNVKTQLTSYFNADVNLGYRQLNTVDNGEVYYTDDMSTLKGLKIDSSIPEDTPWEKGWLNRWYSEWKENAKWKLIIQGVYTFVFTYIIGIWMIWEGVGQVVTGLQATGGGTYGMQTIGAVIAALFGVILVFVGIAWIIYWVTSDADNRLIEEMVGLKNIRPDRKNVDGSYSFNENRLRQFEDNYWAYDNTHSIPNRWEVSYGMTDPYNTCVCPIEYHNKIVYSNRQSMDSQVDSWRNFKPNNSLEIPADMGQLQKMFILGNSIYAHTTDMIIALLGGGGFNIDTDTTLLGTGDLFGAARPIYGGVVEGYGGLLDPNAAETCAYGYIFPDREARKWYRFTGGGLPEPISDDGVRSFMDINMDLELLKAFPCFKLVDLKLPGGIGYSFGIDHRYKRLLFTKVDYKPIYNDILLDDNGLTFTKGGKKVSLYDPKFFENKSFTLSYDIEKKAWVSFHNYTPYLYAWNRFDMYSFNKCGMWIHNVEGKFQTYYDKWYPFSVEYVVNDIESGDSFKYHGSVLGTEAYKWKTRDYVHVPITFDKGLFYNAQQMTGYMDMIEQSSLSQVERHVQNDSRTLLEYKNNIWTFNDVPDKIIDPQDFKFDPKDEIGPYKVNSENVGVPTKNNIFRGNYFANRLIFNKFDDIKLILKRIDTKIELNNR